MKKKINFLLVARLLTMIGCILMFSVFFIPFSSAISLLTGDYEKIYGNAYSFFFGGTIETKNISYESTKPSVLGIIGFVFMIIALLLLVFSLLYKKNKDVMCKWMTFASALLAIVYSIIFLCMHQSLATVLADALIGGHSDAVTKTIFNNSSVEFGVWGVSIFGFLGSFFVLASLVFDGTLDKVRERIGIL